MRKLILLPSFLVVALLPPHYGWTQERQVLHAPIITHAYATDRGPYGTNWKIYIEAEDPGGDMDSVFVVVEQTGYGGYPPEKNGTHRISRPQPSSIPSG